jgi:hypothetical protein
MEARSTIKDVAFGRGNVGKVVGMVHVVPGLSVVSNIPKPIAIPRAVASGPSVVGWFARTPVKYGGFFHHTEDHTEGGKRSRCCPMTRGRLIDVPDTNALLACSGSTRTRQAPPLTG